MSIELGDAAATEALAARLATAIPANGESCMILLQGELGAGKSTLARAMLRKLGHDGPVPSPTYTLVEPYEIAGRSIYHIDLYRIAGLEELEYLGWQDLQGGLLLIEWPERAPELNNIADLRIALTYEGQGRRASIEGLSEQGRVIAAAVLS